MNRIILASHGGMSAGVRDTMEMVMGELPNLYAVATTRDETESVVTAVRRLLDSFDPAEQVFILTDVLGGSVNNDMVTLLPDYPKARIICGMNLSLVLCLCMASGPLDPDEIQEVIRQAQGQIIDCTKMLMESGSAGCSARGAGACL